MATYPYATPYIPYGYQTIQNGAQVFQPYQSYSPTQSFSQVQQGTPAASQNNSPSFICRPVASYEEATATPTDFNGNILVLTDLYHGMIYTKMLDPKTGSSVFAAYRYVPPEQQPAPSTETKQIQYAPVAYVEQLENEIKRIREELEESKKATQKKQVGKGSET